MLPHHLIQTDWHTIITSVAFTNDCVVVFYDLWYMVVVDEGSTFEGNHPTKGVWGWGKTHQMKENKLIALMEVTHRAWDKLSWIGWMPRNISDSIVVWRVKDFRVLGLKLSSYNIAQADHMWTESGERIWHCPLCRVSLLLHQSTHHKLQARDTLSHTGTLDAGVDNLLITLPLAQAV